MPLPTESWWFKRTGAVNLMLVIALIAGMLLWSEPLLIPGWVVVAFMVLVVFPLGIVASVKRYRAENRLARSVWRALTQR